MKSGMNGENSFMVDMTRKSIPEDFVKVSISSKDNYAWDATGEAGIVAVAKGEHTEMDYAGAGDKLVQLIATILLKIEQGAGRKYAEAGIKLYIKER